jgi:hypothetical protein
MGQCLSPLAISLSPRVPSTRTNSAWHHWHWHVNKLEKKKDTGLQYSCRGKIISTVRYHEMDFSLLAIRIRIPMRHAFYWASALYIGHGECCFWLNYSSGQQPASCFVVIRMRGVPIPDVVYGPLYAKGRSNRRG